MIKKELVILAFFALTVFSQEVFAGPPASLQIKNVKLKSVALYTQGGNSIAEVYFEPSGPVNTGCAPTDQLHIVSYWRNNVHTTDFALRLSHWMAALSSGATVDIILEGTTCNTSATYPNEGGVSGMGRFFSAMRVYAE